MGPATNVPAKFRSGTNKKKYNKRGAAFWYAVVCEVEALKINSGEARSSAFAKYDNVSPTTYRRWRKRFSDNPIQYPIPTAGGGLSPPVKKKPTRSQAGVTYKYCGHHVIAELVPPQEQLNWCPTCVTGGIINNQQYHADYYLKHTLMAKKNSTSVDWENGTHELKVKSGALPNNIPFDVLADDEWTSFVGSTIKYRLLDLGTNIDVTKQKMDLLSGSFHPTKNVFEYSDDQLLSNPKDGSIGVVTWNTWKNTPDFAILDRVDISNESVVAICKQETEHISLLETAKRCGPSGGYANPSTDSKFDYISCTPITKENRVFHKNKTGNSTQLTCRYFNGLTQRIVDFEQVYTDPFMARYNKKEKRDGLLQHKCVREKTIVEMKSRVKALVLVDHLGLVNSSFPGRSMAGLDQAFDRYAINEQCWIEADPGLSPFEMVLLEYACGTGEMRNHQALAAHKDSNKSHFMESMTLFGRIGKCSKKKSDTKLADSQVSGLMSLP